MEQKSRVTEMEQKNTVLAAYEQKLLSSKAVFLEYRNRICHAGRSCHSSQQRLDIHFSLTFAQRHIVL